MVDQSIQQENNEQLELLANRSLSLWDIPEGATARLINISENATFLVEGPQEFRSILRVHRENYHSLNAIKCELAWSKALSHEGFVPTPAFFIGKNGEPIQTSKTDEMLSPRHMVMFEFVEGSEPNQEENLAELFEHLGEIAAQTHNHSLQWKRPDHFERLIWNTETVFGPEATWGDWRKGPNVGRKDREILEKLEKVIIKRLNAYGRSPDRYGLIHADMRLANLLIKDGKTHLIDFDDCGLGWYMYDFAAGISFMEEHPQVPQLKEAWVKGYRKARPLTQVDYDEIDSFMMLRRMALLAWMGTHPEVEIVKELSPHFCENTVLLAKRYLVSFAPERKGIFSRFLRK